MTEKRIRINFRGRLGFRTAARAVSRTSNDRGAAVPAVPSGDAWLLPWRQVFVAAVSLTAISIAAVAVRAQTPQQSYPAQNGGFAPASTLSLPPLPVQQPITPNGAVVEDVIARVNNQIITRSEYQRAEEQLLQEAQQQNLSEGELKDRQQNLLRDMIDQQLLLSKGKELGITGDADTMRELDDIRKKNNLPDMEALQKAAAQQGVSFEDFKEKIRDSAITQQVVRDEVGRHLNLTHAQEASYYTAHAKDFEVPEQVHLSEILISTPEDATEAQLAAAQAKADKIDAQLKAGANFAQLAKTDSGGSTAAAGGDLGDFKRGALGSALLENATFPLPVGGQTAPIRTKQGYVILRVDSHQAAGVPPLSAVEPQVEEAIYLDQLQPALRTYLTKAREQAYLTTAPGYIDTGSTRRATRAPDIAYTAYKPPAIKKKVLAKQHAEQQRAARAQTELASAREKLAEKQAAKAQANSASGKRNVVHAMRPPKIHREKIRYGQAPEKSLPPAAVQTAETSGNPGGVTGEAPGVAMSPTSSLTSITTGTGVDAETTSDDLAPKAAPTHKTRFSGHETDSEEVHAKAKLAKAEVTATDRPLAQTPTESATEKLQAAPLGLSGDTTKKPKKPKHQKGEQKERLQEKPKPSTGPAPVAPTVNPALAPALPSASEAPATTPAPNPPAQP